MSLTTKEDQCILHYIQAQEASLHPIPPKCVQALANLILDNRITLRSTIPGPPPRPLLGDSWWRKFKNQYPKLKSNYHRA